MKDEFPLGFLTRGGGVILRSKKHVSADGTPRYVCNPKSPDNTYCLEDCMDDWHPIYTYKELRRFISEEESRK